MKAKTLIIRIAAVVVLLAIGAVMMVIGRGHTLYFDNKTLEYNGETYKSFQKVVVNVKDQNPSTLFARERGSATWIGQNFTMDLTVVREKNGAEENYTVGLSLPYGVDGIIINLPAVLAGLSQDAWFSEFIPTPSSDIGSEEELPGDEFGSDEIGSENMGM